MREHVNGASRRRDERLARIRKLSLWITGGAAAASLGMGTAFAHAIPGHSVSARGSSTATGSSASGGSSGTGSSAANGSTSGGAGPSSQPGTGRHHHHRLAPPASAPAPAPSAAPAAPVVSSGGS